MSNEIKPYVVLENCVFYPPVGTQGEYIKGKIVHLADKHGKIYSDLKYVRLMNESKEPQVVAKTEKVEPIIKQPSILDVEPVQDDKAVYEAKHSGRGVYDVMLGEDTIVNNYGNKEDSIVLVNMLNSATPEEAQSLIAEANAGK